LARNASSYDTAAVERSGTHARYLLLRVVNVECEVERRGERVARREREVPCRVQARDARDGHRWELTTEEDTQENAAGYRYGRGDRNHTNQPANFSVDGVPLSTLLLLTCLEGGQTTTACGGVAAMVSRSFSSPTKLMCVGDSMATACAGI
jgi:hypothetical protein